MISTASGSMDVRLWISKEGYVTKPTNPIFHAFVPSNVNTNTDIVFGQRDLILVMDIILQLVYTAPATGYYHFYCQVYRQTTSSDSWWVFIMIVVVDRQTSESRMENDYGGDSGRYQHLIFDILVYDCGQKWNVELVTLVPYIVIIRWVICGNLVINIKHEYS